MDDEKPILGTPTPDINSHLQTVLESHTRRLKALRCMAHFPPFPQTQKKKKKYGLQNQHPYHRQFNAKRESTPLKTV